MDPHRYPPLPLLIRLFFGGVGNRELLVNPAFNFDAYGIVAPGRMLEPPESRLDEISNDLFSNPIINHFPNW